MDIEKIRNLGPEELIHQQREAADQLFRLKFQLKMGQTTGVKKMRELRKDLARIKTIARQRELSGNSNVPQSAVAAAPQKTASAAPTAATTVPKKAAKKTAAKPAAKKSTAAKSTAAKKSAAKKSTAKR